ncbi:unnamed protein product, partial [Effrenium voratum]
ATTLGLPGFRLCWRQPSAWAACKMPPASLRPTCATDGARTCSDANWPFGPCPGRIPSSPPIRTMWPLSKLRRGLPQHRPPAVLPLPLQTRTFWTSISS